MSKTIVSIYADYEKLAGHKLSDLDKRQAVLDYILAENKKHNIHHIIKSFLNLMYSQCRQYASWYEREIKENL